MRKRSLPTCAAEGRTQHKFRRPHVVPALALTVSAAHFNLNVLICKPEFGNYHHWAVQLDNLSTGDGTIFEVQGAYPSFTFTTYQCRRLYYPLKIIQTIRVKEFVLSMSAFNAITQAIENQVPVDDDPAVHWNCQDYVLEVLDMLEQEWWLEDDDADYLKVRRKLKSMFGPVELVQDAVTAYPASPVSDHGDRVDDVSKVAEPKCVRSAEKILDSDDDEDG